MISEDEARSAELKVCGAPANKAANCVNELEKNEFMDVSEAPCERLSPSMKYCGKCDYGDETSDDLCPRCQTELFNEGHVRAMALMPLLGGIGMMMVGIVGAVTSRQVYAARTVFRPTDEDIMKLSVAVFVFVGIVGLLMLGFAALQLKTARFYRRTTRILYITAACVWLFVEIYLAYLALS